MTDADLGGDALGRLLEDTRHALGALRDRGPGTVPEAAEPAEPLRGVGTAADGKVAARVVSGGHLEELRVDPRMMRLGSEELCAQILVAVNAAMDDLRAQTSQVDAGGLDPAALAETLESLQADSARQMGLFTQGVAETVARISAASGGGGHVR